MMASDSIWPALGLGLALYLAVAMLPLLINVGLLLFLVVLLALLISPLTDRRERRKIPRGWTVTGVLLCRVTPRGNRGDPGGGGAGGDLATARPDRAAFVRAARSPSTAARRSTRHSFRPGAA
jgi:hypothetical protein